MLNSKFFSSLAKEVKGVAMSDSSAFMPSGYLSTGNYAVNKILCGSMFGGVPEGRITTFYGESGCAPETATVYILCRVNDKNRGFLESLKDKRADFSSYFNRMTVQKRLELLLSLGYTMTDLSKELKVSRQTLYTASHSDKVVTERKSTRVDGNVDSYRKIALMLNRLVYRVQLKHVDNLFDSLHLSYRTAKRSEPHFFVFTPFGWKTCSKLSFRGEKDCVTIVSECAGKKFSTTVSVDHLIRHGGNNDSDNVSDLSHWNNGMNYLNSVKTPNADAETVDVLSADKEIPVESAKVISVVSAGTQKCYDLEIGDEHHCYFLDDVVAHNSGKSLMAEQVVISALRNGYDAVYYIDAEGGVLLTRLQSAGVNLDKVFHVLAPTIEECQIALIKIYQGIAKAKEENEANGQPRPRCLVVLDSLGALVPQKNINDVTEKDKVVADMGLTAKMKNQMMRQMFGPVMSTQCPMLVINHSYDTPDAIGHVKFHAQSGGSMIKYSSHIIIQTSASKKRQEDTDKGIKGGGSYFSGTELRFCSFKNRVVKEGYEAIIYADLNEGIGKYEGLLTDAQRLGFIVRGGAYYSIPSYGDGTKKLTYDQLMHDDAAWGSFLPKMDEIFKKEMAYSNNDLLEKLDGDKKEEESGKDVPTEENTAKNSDIESIPSEKTVKKGRPSKK
jgi:RecA/RadA recombinase